MTVLLAVDFLQFLVIEGLADAVVFGKPASEVHHLAAGGTERSHGWRGKINGHAAGGAGDGFAGLHGRENFQIICCPAGAQYNRRTLLKMP